MGKPVRNLTDKRLFMRFFSVNLLGAIADYLLALFLASILGLPYIAATTGGFLFGTFVNYCGHSRFTYGQWPPSFRGFVKFLLAVILSLAVRLVVVAGLDRMTTLPFWIMLLIAIGASFLMSYVISTLWVFKRSDMS